MAYDSFKIIKAIASISKEDRADVCLNVELFLNDTENSSYRHEIIKAIASISKEDRADVCLNVEPFLNDTENSSYRHEIIKAIASTSKENRADICLISPLVKGEKTSNEFLELAKDILLAPKNERKDICKKAELSGVAPYSSWVRILVLECMERFEQENKDEACRNVELLLRAKGKANEFDYYFTCEVIKLIPKEDRADVCQKALPLIEHIKSGDLFDLECGLLINTIASIPGKDRADVCQKALPLIERSYHTVNEFSSIISVIESVRKEDRAAVCSFLLTLTENNSPEFLLIINNQTRFFKFLMQKSLILKQSICARLNNELGSHDQVVAERASNLIITFYRDGILDEEEFIVQEAIRIRTLLENSNDPLNPYKFYENLKLKREISVTIDLASLPTETIFGKKVWLVPGSLKKLPQVVVTYKDLPCYSKDFFTTMDNQIKKRLSEPNNKLELPNYNNFTTGALGGNYLDNLLNTQGKSDEVVPLIVSKLIAAVAYYESLENTHEVGTFSKREENFLLMLASIQHCKTGKDGGINDCYARLPEKVKYKALSSSIAHECLETIVRMKVEEVFTGSSNLFKTILCKIPNEEVNQEIHQILYVKNLIGHEVGLTHSLMFDNHSQCLNAILVSLSKEAVLKAFYTCLPPHVVIDGVLEGVNKRIQGNRPLCNKLIKMTDQGVLEKAWAFDNNYNPSLTEYGAIHLLSQLGVLEEIAS